MSTIEWQSVLGYAEDSAESTRKPILLDFFDHECVSCKQMEEVTFQSDDVVSFVKEFLIPVRIDIAKKTSYDKYNVIWTPTLFVLDFEGNEVQQTIGFLEPKTFIPIMHLGIAKALFSIEEFDAANVHFKRLIDRYPESSALPEAIYFSGVNLYKQKDEPIHLKKAYENLLSNFPGSVWAKRAAPYQAV